MTFGDREAVEPFNIFYYCTPANWELARFYLEKWNN